VFKSYAARSRLPPEAAVVGKFSYKKSNIISTLLLSLQVTNLTYACGNAGVANVLQLTYNQKPNMDATFGATSNMQVRFGGVTFANIMVPATGKSTLTTFQGATVTPTSQGVNQWTVVTLNVPCQTFNGSTLSFVHNAGSVATDTEISTVSIRACVSETCGGQGIVCPGLKATKACTPGYDCMLC
jgi:hypothetical protein